MIDDLRRPRALYPAPGERALRKQMGTLDRHALHFVGRDMPRTCGPR